MTTIEGTWSLSFLFGLLAACAMFIAAVVAGVLLLRWARRNAYSFDEGTARALGWGALGFAVLVVIGTAVSTFPWEREYHRFEPKVGEVQVIDKRLVAQGGGMQEKIVVRFADLPGQWGCEDTRCALVKPGDMLALRCIKRWDYSATDGYDCRFVAHEGRA